MGHLCFMLIFNDFLGFRVLTALPGWPPYSPDLSPLDFSLWGQALAHVVRCQPKTIDELKAIVNDFAVNLGEEKIRSMARHTRKRAELCCQVRGGHFEHLMQKKQ